MADSTVAALTAASALDGTELYYSVQGGADRKVTGAQIKTLALATPTITGHPTIEGVTSTGATGTGKLVFDGTPTLVTPVIGAATGTSLNLTGAVTALNSFGDVVALTDGATPALNASLGSEFTLSAAGDRTIAVPSNATDGQKIVIRHFASGAARTLALNTGAGGFRFGSDITALTQTASGKTDYIGCIYNGTDSFWDVVAYKKGF